MPAQLVSLSAGPSILLDKPILLIGRHPECDIQIDSRKVSRRHCCIAQVNDYLVVRDLGSTNGIRINGVRVLEGRLKASDELTIGGSQFRVSSDVVPEVPLHSQQGQRRAEFHDMVRSVQAVDDDALESCDEPVALAEPGGVPVAIPVGNRQAPSDPLIPDVLKLAPSSDADVSHGQKSE